MAKKKERPVPQPCSCGGALIMVKNKKGGWGVVCLECDSAVFNYPTETDAVEAWNEEVQKHGDASGKRH